MRNPLHYWLRALACLLALGFAAGCSSLGDENAAAAHAGHQQLLITFAPGEEHETGLLNAFANQYHRGNYGAALSTRRQISAVEKDYPIHEEAGWTINSLGIYCVLFAVNPDTDVDQLLQRLGADSRIDSAQLLLSYQTHASVSYNDPYFGLQYGRAQPFILELHRAATGKGVRIAVVDTGIDPDHPDLERQLAGSEDFLGDGKQASHQDIHGTAVAGVIAAQGNNGSGIVGIAPDARIYSLKACRQLQPGSSLASCDSFTLARALDYAIMRGIDIINLSLSGPQDPLLARLVESALARDLVITAADPGTGEARYPALLPGVIAVREDPLQAAPGAESDPHGLLVVAPGREILSTGPGGGYDFYTGSSIATAIVSGLTAVLLEEDRDMPPAGRVAWINDALRREIGPADNEPRPTKPLAMASDRVQSEKIPIRLEF
ncbi:serine protease [Mangrovimicrobium sediminis]|uniref:Serine protease n=1 Tax=Mangrovimicrobium sediminis TaxID=2562682 RepID=A0A4Z0M9A7_9GAMM|nr:S8 family serine peptidase [Haliea sp. SAOS-164]TGD75978.1 serine protease [Haliea sp. SAOS-164]